MIIAPASQVRTTTGSAHERSGLTIQADRARDEAGAQVARPNRVQIVARSSIDPRLK
ncbi:hypothetical protein AruPA_10955 [Acidiphilium sp. PA]|uniref:hypothetical protein n=1 Tax=Acidiphilium sp. PA TaxID=2871705 RepID=UPI00224378BD|nr:hypothetical protein [Acidiphilium sp. PA]MCW8307557.1 hypothetical protein [Acidiphilium sp. PA]